MSIGRNYGHKEGSGGINGYLEGILMTLGTLTRKKEGELDLRQAVKDSRNLLKG